MRLYGRTRSYHDLDGTQLERAAASVPWYWRVVAIASSAMILGGFLMLPATFDTDPQMRVSQLGVGVFAVVLLVAGFCATVLICIVVPSLPYRTDTVLMPAFLSCVLGFLTVWYCFILSSRYTLNIFAILEAVVAGVGAFVYAGLLIASNKKVARSRNAPPGTVQLHEDVAQPLTDSSRWQSQKYYQNYVKNMFPSASYEPHNIPHDPQPITEEELQRQQMLMLLLSQDPETKPDSTASTFRIDWHGQEQDQEPSTPLQTHFRPYSYQQSPQQLPTNAVLQVPGQMRPWDGVWRGVSQQSRVSELSTEADVPDSREARRREIELGA